jgi:hypothetical protein
MCNDSSGEMPFPDVARLSGRAWLLPENHDEADVGMRVGKGATSQVARSTPLK